MTHNTLVQSIYLIETTERNDVMPLVIYTIVRYIGFSVYSQRIRKTFFSPRQNIHTAAAIIWYYGGFLQAGVPMSITILYIVKSKCIDFRFELWR